MHYCSFDLLPLKCQRKYFLKIKIICFIAAMEFHCWVSFFDFFFDGDLTAVSVIDQYSASLLLICVHFLPVMASVASNDITKTWSALTPTIKNVKLT